MKWLGTLLVTIAVEGTVLAGGCGFNLCGDVVTTNYNPWAQGEAGNKSGGMA